MSSLEIIEAAGTITGIICVWLFIRQNVWAWPVAVVSAALFGVVFLDAGLYSNMGLQAFYIGLAFYGWHQWRRGGPKQAGVKVQHLIRRQGAVLGMLVLLTATILVAMLVFITRGAPITPETMAAFIASEHARSLDALATAMSLAGTWMQANKILENWLLWIVTDIILAGVFFSQGLYFTTALYMLYLVMASLGYQAWRKDLR